MNGELRRLIFQSIDGTISDEDFDQLQQLLESDPAARKEYLEAVSLSESLASLSAEFPVQELPRTGGRAKSQDSATRVFGWWQLVVAAILLLGVGVSSFWFGSQQASDEATAQQLGSSAVQSETQIAGHAILRRIVELEWGDSNRKYHEGDVLADGSFVFQSGVVEIDFFCGASLIVEGPANLEIESDWTLQVNEGRLRANVPPAARGFIVKAANSEIVDLGTEFVLDVNQENTRVEVVDGEVELRGGQHDGEHLETGERALLKGSAMPSSVGEGVSTVSQLHALRDEAEAKRFASWRQGSQEYRRDKRLIAYFPIAQGLSDRMVADASSRAGTFDGRVVGPVEHVAGRFGSVSTGLEFDRPGARVRTRIDGEFSAYTFVCWVRIDSLEHKYNALFMGDGYENGEPHWQIRDDGCLMFSVMVDDSQEIERFNEFDQKMVKDAGLHRVYYSKPFWDISKSGQWFHIAAVYDPASRVVVQFVNGEQIAREEIIDKFLIDKLRIGAAEIGNWGQPFRKTPWFAVRNLNGTIDELAIYGTALTSGEIRDLFERGKPLGY